MKLQRIRFYNYSTESFPIYSNFSSKYDIQVHFSMPSTDYNDDDDLDYDFNDEEDPDDDYENIDYSY